MVPLFLVAVTTLIITRSFLFMIIRLRNIGIAISIKLSNPIWKLVGMMVVPNVRPKKRGHINLVCGNA
jgi:hypothetical protein